MSDQQPTDRQRAADFTVERAEPILVASWYAGRDEDGGAGVVMTVAGDPAMPVTVAVELLRTAANGLESGDVKWADQ